VEQQTPENLFQLQNVEMITAGTNMTKDENLFSGKSGSPTILKILVI